MQLVYLILKMGSCCGLKRPEPYIQKELPLPPKVKQPTYDYGNNIDVSDLCADLSYFLVLPFKAHEANDPKRRQTIPYLIVFSDHNLTMKEIMQDYKKMNPQVESKYIQFTFNTGRAIMEDWTIRELSLMMGGTSVNGLNLFTSQQFYYELQVQKMKQQASNPMVIECCISNYFSSQDEFGRKELNLSVQLTFGQKQKQFIGIRISGYSELSALKKAIANQIIKLFDVKRHQFDIQDVINTETSQPLRENKPLFDQRLYDRSRVIVPMIGINTPLKRLRVKDYNSYIIIYKQGEKDPRRYKYNRISEMTFSQLYWSKLVAQQSKQRTDLNYCLKINDMIIKPNERISLAQIYFKNQNREPLYVVGKVINEKIVFFYLVPSLISSEDQFILDSHIQVRQAQKGIFESVKQQSKKMYISKSSIQPSSRQKSFEPIMFYTSNVKVYEKRLQSEDKVYKLLNIFLRQSQLLTLQPDDVKSQWRYLYSSAILKQLQNIPPCNLKGYRGISYDDMWPTGKVITFKQFLSTSRKRETGLKFAVVRRSPQKILLQLDILQGYPIREYSLFSNEDQVMLEPFTDFKVTDMKVTEQQYNNKPYKVKTYYLQQLLTSKKMPPVKGNIVVWVDDKPKEGQRIFELMTFPPETVMLIQLVSTQQLANWLNRNDYLFKDPTAKIIFITNMARREHSKLNQLAGIQGLRQIRKHSTIFPVFFYIGDTEKASRKLQESRVDTTNVTVSKSSRVLYDFIMQQVR